MTTIVPSMMSIQPSSWPMPLSWIRVSMPGAKGSVEEA